MQKSMREIIEGKVTEELEERKEELYRKILYKQRLLDKYRYLIAQTDGNCFEFIREYEMIDRVVFFRQKKVKLISSIKSEGKKMIPVKKKVEDLTKTEASTLLEQLLALKRSRQSDKPL
ncbi:hypothetical protein KAX02_13520 [candidate division WOR-3 bacterium]|nr:hypothetical protein [candidate division WOR-3 bacterium]